MERYAAKSRNFVRRYLVIRRSFYGAHPFYGCATLLFSLYCKEAVFFYMLLIMTNFEASRSHVVDTHKELFQSSVCCDKIFLASAYHTLSIQILRNYLIISQKPADHLTCQRQTIPLSPFISCRPNLPLTSCHHDGDPSPPSPAFIRRVLQLRSK